MNEKTLTAEQCSKLSLYILMTTKTREGEAATWEKLAEEWAQTSALAKIAVISESND